MEEGSEGLGGGGNCSEKVKVCCACKREIGRLEMAWAELEGWFIGTKVLSEMCDECYIKLETYPPQGSTSRRDDG